MYKLSSGVRAPFKPPRPLGSSLLTPPSSQAPSGGSRIPSSQRPSLKRKAVEQPAIPPTQISANGKTRYVVQWRKVTNKKNKTWNGDGTIDVAGELVTAKIDGRTITKSVPNIEGIFKIGGYELEIDCVDGPVKETTNEVKQLPRTVPRLVPTFKKTKPVVRPKKQVYPKNEDSFVLKFRDSDTEMIMDPQLTKILRPHQREGILFMTEGILGYRFDGNGVLLADDMGLGKTLMTISLIWTLLKQSPHPEKQCEINKVLIICPVTLINNWQKEFKKWLNLNQLGVLVIDNNTSNNYKQIFTNFEKSRVHQVLIMSYERLLSVEEEIQACKFDLLVCDEGHKLKNNSSKSLKILNSLDIEKKILLTGTPIQNNLTEFYNLIHFLNPGILGTFSSFQRKFIKPIENSRDTNCYNPEIISMGKQVSKELTAITKQIMLRRTNSILHKYLSTKTDILLFSRPTTFQNELFHKLLQNIPFSSLNNNPNILNMINIFKKICNSPSLLKDDNLFKSMSINLDLPISSSKLELLIMLLLEIINFQKEKVVIVSNYTKTLDILESVMKKLLFEFLRLDGSSSTSSRSSMINKFNNVPFPKYPVFLLSSKSGGFGINLIGAPRLILFDNDWNPANDLQAMSRVYRDGQKKPVFIYRLFTAGCLDEKILQRQLMKNNLSDKFLDDGKNNLNIFDTQDLKDLFTINDTSSNTHDLLECGCDGSGNNEPYIATQESEDSLPKSSMSEGYISALSFNKLDQGDQKSIKNALPDYKHYDPAALSFRCEDAVVNSIVSKNRDKISYVFSKVSNGEEEQDIDEVEEVINRTIEDIGEDKEREEDEDEDEDEEKEKIDERVEEKEEEEDEELHDDVHPDLFVDSEEESEYGGVDSDDSDNYNGM